MPNQIYTQKELKILNESKTIEILKTRRTINFILALIFTYTVIQDIFYIVSKYKLHQSITSLIIALIFDSVILFYLSKKVIQYNVIIIKYNKINDENTNPLVAVCNEKISKCKILLLNKENYYVVKNSYIELKTFLENNKDLLPQQTYINAEKELNYIGDEMINCDIKKCTSYDTYTNK